MATRSMLVNFVGYPNEIFNLMPDNGLANLAACLIRAGHETLIWDCSTISMMERLYPYHEKKELDRLTSRLVSKTKEGKKPAVADVQAFTELERRIEDYQEQKIRELGKEMGEYVHHEKLDFVGFKLWTGIGFYGSIILAKEIRKLNPHVRIFGGGPHVDWFMHKSFEITDTFDVFAYGEGEEVIVQLAEFAEGKRALRDIANAIYLENGNPITNSQIRVEDLDSIPVPCYDEDVYPAMKGNEKIKLILLDESRGCPNKCSFCIHPIKSGGQRRIANAGRFVDRLEQVIKKYNFRSFRFAGSNPPLGLRREISQEIIQRGLDVSFTAFAHVRGANLDDFKLLRMAGCKALSFGVESGSQQILDESMNKRVKVNNIQRSLKLCKEAGIAVVISLIVPAPHETEETKEETFQLLLDIRPDATHVYFPILAPGTAWERDKERFGFQIGDIEAFFQEAMTHRFNAFAPAILWRPLVDYKLNGKTFQELAKETADFRQRVKKAGLSTQIFDQVFLMAELVGEDPATFTKLTTKCMADGAANEMRELVARINRHMFERVKVAN